MPSLIAMIAAAAVAAPAPPAPAPVLIKLSRYREAGATVRKLTVRRDGAVAIDDPGGGAGRRQSSKQLTPHATRSIHHLVARTPWSHLSKHGTTLPEVDPVAYFVVRHGGEDTVTFNGRVSADLKPLIRRLNAILDTGGATLDFHYFSPS